MSIDLVRFEKNLNKYFYVTYDVESTVSIFDAAWNIAVGQSIGNPSKRSIWETDEMIEAHCAKIMHSPDFDKKSGRVIIAYPLANINFKNDGISQLLATIIGGQVDIGTITKCRVIDLEIADDLLKANFLGPKHGLTGMRKKTGQYNKPLFGGIVKPKVGLKPNELLDMVKELVDGGVDFVKEDEILGDVEICRLEDRVELISNYIRDTNVVYTFCINSDADQVLKNARFVYENGGCGVHTNIWSGLGTYRSIRNMNTNLYIHYQKSGDRVITDKRNPFGVSWPVLCKLAVMSGVDTIHSGMIGGYLDSDEEEMLEVLKILRAGNVVPALSCGMTAELIAPIAEKIGMDWMANVGGGIHSDPKGSTAGALKIRNAIEAVAK